MTTLDDTKKALRKQASMARKQAFDAMPDAADRIASFASHLHDRFSPSIIAAYWPIRTEIDPIPLLHALSQQGAKTCLPSTPQEGLPLTFHEWRDGDALIDGPYNTKEPQPKAPIIIPDMILAPLLAYDAQYWRLGYGGGFYDRTLAKLEQLGHQVKVIGIAFDESEVEMVPIGAYDKQLDGILTPSGLRHGDAK